MQATLSTARSVSRWLRASTLAGLLAVVCVALVPHTLCAGPLDEMSLERWAKLRETERYQLKIAEKYYNEQNWKVALAEYEKFLTLHEKSEGAPYAQLKWSLCQVRLRKLNTAIKDGFQSVVDYWPESPEATAAAYFIARTYKDVAELKSAKKAYATVLERHPEHLVSAFTKSDLIDIARIENDQKRRVALWKELTFNTDRKGGAAGVCQQASYELATHLFYEGDFANGVKALETTYSPPQMPYHLYHYSNGAISTLTGDEKKKALGEKLADEGIAYITKMIPENSLTDEAAKGVAKTYLFYIADLHSVARRPTKVREVYDQILKTYGQADDVLGRLAGWLKGQGQRDEARRVYARFTNEIEGQNQIAWSFREEGKRDEAIEIYRQLAIKDTQNSSGWHAQVGHTLREAGRYKEAIAAYRLWESYADAYYYMAVCHRELKEFNEAVALFGQVMATEPRRGAEALLQIGYTYDRAGEKEKAIKALQQVCVRFPTAGEASQAHSFLNEKYKITATKGGAKAE